MFVFSDHKKSKSGGKLVTNDDMGEELDYVPCLFDINLEVREGQLVGVAGAVGAGKSSLIGAIMGEVTFTLFARKKAVSVSKTCLQNVDSCSLPRVTNLI